MTRTRRKGFTLVELIIVVIILGILAALAIPQFIDTTQDAREATLKANLKMLRNAIQLYYHQHDSSWPGAHRETDGSAATTDAQRQAAFEAQLTQYSNKQGECSDTLDRANYPYGPYLIDIPVNPAGAQVISTVTAVSVNGPLENETLSGSGWRFSVETGELIPDVEAYKNY